MPNKWFDKIINKLTSNLSDDDGPPDPSGHVVFKPEMLEKLYDPDEKVRAATAELLGHTADERAIEALITAISDHSWSGYREATEISLVNHLGNEESGSIAITRHSNTLTSAVQALVRLKATTATPTIVKLLNDDRADPIRSTIVQALGKIGNPDAIEGLLERYRKCILEIKKPYAISLKQLGWKPDSPQEAAEFYLVLEDNDALLQTGQGGADRLFEIANKGYPGDKYTEKIFEILVQMGDQRVADIIVKWIQIPKRQVASENQINLSTYRLEERKLMALTRYLARLKDPRVNEYYLWVLNNTNDYQIFNQVVSFGDPSLAGAILECAGRNNWMRALAKNYISDQFPEGTEKLFETMKPYLENAGFLPYVKDMWDNALDDVLAKQKLRK